MSSAAAAATATSQLQSSLRELHIGEKGSTTPDILRPKLTTSAISSPIPVTKKKKAPVVADSWEDEADTVSEGENENAGDLSQAGSTDSSLPMSPAAVEGPLDPPPTPISPQTSQPWVNTSAYTSVGSAGPGPGSAGARDPNRRPEKQTAVAGRLIAAGLGIRAPKRTEEQRAYDRAVKEQEIRRRNKEREEAAKLKEEEEKAKAAVWDA
ncbi:hypothetical protein ASPCAL08978 [Aspergillus calidoustus]|uniref:Ubiquitin-like protein smt3 n=1 Tax=Aspergillus calidoustus TaxID=454130 RepID=A0A0U5GRT9_ASPCI|nr:hypothetical protein ASPCAL08978 [Aspergillus calidoustus]